MHSANDPHGRQSPRPFTVDRGVNHSSGHLGVDGCARHFGARVDRRGPRARARRVGDGDLKRADASDFDEADDEQGDEREDQRELHRRLAAIGRDHPARDQVTFPIT